MQMLLIIYSCLLLSGAYFGLKAGSRVSLFMGIISGVLMLATVYLISQDHAYGYWCATSISGLLTIVFFIRLIKTRKFMPAGMLFAVSAAVLIGSVTQVISS